MKARICVIYANTKWGCQMRPLKFPSIRRAKEYAKEMIEDGYWFAYRIKVLNH